VARSIVVSDPDASRRDWLTEIARSSKAEVTWAGPEVLTGSSDDARIHRVGLVALTCEPTVTDPSLQLIHSWRTAGLDVLAYAVGAEGWRIRSRCLPLLAGASQLLDAAQGDFARALAASLTRAFDAEAQRRADYEKVRATMTRLGLVGESQTIFSLFRTVMRISPLSDVPVLITGETGTGKELLARAIHSLDPKRAKGPFVALNCAALTNSLAEAELFGHRRGAFTGAERDRLGLIRAADGGVLFLDEIGELDLALQAKLLRVLQENRVLRVGDEHEVPVSVRVIAATNRDLTGLTERHEFRADLLHRVSVLALHIPPLRQRRADIAPLIHHVLEKNRHLRPDWQAAVAEDFVEALCQTALRGNVRQLENVVRQAMVHKETHGPLQLCDLPSELWQDLCGSSLGSLTPAEPTDHPSDQPAHDPSPARANPGQLWGSVLRENGYSLARSLLWCERGLLAAALESTHGNQSRTARLLGITARSVYNKVRRHQTLR
jgi:transcriptional regulator with GAF, ATPase, and Fis domain